MIRPNDFTATNREDDLLKRLKNCVGSLQTTSKDPNRIPSTKEPQQFKSKEIFSHQLLDDRKYDSRSSHRPSLGNKQNLTEKKYYARQQDFRKLTKDKQNCDVLKMTKNYLQNTRQNIRPYQTDRKQSLPLTEMSNLSSAKRELFAKQVTDSTKKRIAERQFLINGENNNITPIKLPERPKNRCFNEDEFLQRLSLRKISYLDQQNPTKQRNSQAVRNSQHKRSVQITRNTSNIKQQYDHNQQKRKPAIFQSEQRPQLHSEVGNLPKYQNYSKIAMQNLVKDQDLRKAQKMEKLKKITNMNEEINKKIRKIVDTFENYLTHRQI